MRDLNRYVVHKNAVQWKETGVELGLKDCVLGNVAKDNSEQIVACFRDTLKKWLRSTPSASWRVLEVALTNVRRKALQLDPVDDLYGKNLHTACLLHKEV